MKKIKMLFFSLMAILSLGLLASCDKTPTDLEEDEEPTVEIPTESETEEVTETPDTDVLDKDFIEDNIREDEKTDVENTLVSDFESTVDLDSSEIVNMSYYNYGIAVIQNEQGNIGFYSLYYNKFLINPCYVKEWVY